MSSTMASSPTARLAESDMDVDLDMAEDGTTTVAPSTPASNVHDEGLGSRLKAIDHHEEIDQDASKEPLDVSRAPGDTGKPLQDDLQARLTRLDILLKKSTVYSKVLGERMNKARHAQKTAEEVNADNATEDPEAETKNQQNRGNNTQSHHSESKVVAGSKRSRQDADENVPSSPKRLKTDAGTAKLEDVDDEPLFKQPDAITGATLKDYQLLGVAWMASLWENGVNGILADEMGLGKTLQTIAFLAYVRQRGAANNTLIVCPLSVLHNWVEEFEKFAPSIPVCMYHGSPEERAEIRRAQMINVDGQPSSSMKSRLHRKNASTVSSKNHPAKDTKSASDIQNTGIILKDKGRRRRGSELPSKATRQSGNKPLQRPTRHSLRHRGARVNYAESDDSEVHEDAQSNSGHEGGEEDDTSLTKNDPAEDSSDTENIDHEHMKDSFQEADKPSAQKELPKNTFPIVLTTYEMIIKDRQYLAKYNWNFIIVDEGHRLKNMDCRLMQEIKKYESANRLILTGTPLHNNLAELWSLLNFILPDIFQDLDSFQQWFNLPTLQDTLSSEHSNSVISKLHVILKPFLLRRLKVDVEHTLPPKKEYVLYAPLSETQRGVYDAVVSGALRSYLINDKQKAHAKPENIKETGKGRSMRKRVKVSYKVDGNDDEWFERLEEGEFNPRNTQREELDAGNQFHYRNAVKQVNSMKLQNTVMQLRKVCSHPFLFDWPADPITREPVVDGQLVNASGKMMVLDRLLDELFRRGHKVLLFSQFTTMLDIIEEWADSFKQWPTCRIDGSTGPAERRAEMHRFQSGGNGPQAPCLFLLSTRAGGLGINLTAADTVIFYDQDWNPQMDLQAMDRAHRIGQSKPVLIFRLVSAHTVETNIMQKANEKRKLEALVIAKGKFRMPGSTNRAKGQTVAEMAASLLKLEGEKIEVVPNSELGRANVISDADLAKLLDRSPEVFADRGEGWTSKTADKGEEAGVAFEVFQAPVDECNDGIAAMMGEKID